MSLPINVRLKVIYFQMEIMLEKLSLKQKGLPCSLIDIQDRLLQVTTDIYHRSNLCVVDGYYQEHPFRFAVVVEGIEHKPAEAVISENMPHIPIENITVLALEFINHMSEFVTHKILKKGYTLEEISKELVFQLWQYKYNDSQEYANALAYLSTQIKSVKIKRIRFDPTHSYIENIYFFED